MPRAVRFALLGLVPAAALALALSSKLPRSLGLATAGDHATAGAFGLAETQEGQNVTIVNLGESSVKPMITGSGVAASKTWDVRDFDSVQIGSTFRARISQGAAYQVTTSADDNILDHIRVAKEGSLLKIGLESGSYSVRSPLTAEITLPALVALDLSGASDTTIAGFESDKDFKLKLSGASKLGGTIRMDHGDFHVDGASTLTLSGSAKAARLRAQGTSHLVLGEFRLKGCDVDLDGASEARIAVQSELPFTAKASGSSQLKGSVKAPSLQLTLDGASHATLGGSAKDGEIRASGVSHVHMTEFSLDAAKLQIDASGASSVKVAGKADVALLKGDGVSHLDLSALVAQTADVKLTGSSHAVIDARGKLSYDLSSVSSLKYLNEPSSKSGKKSGGSSVSRRN
jgi:serine/threonine-protein kinase